MKRAPIALLTLSTLVILVCIAARPKQAPKPNRIPDLPLELQIKCLQKQCDILAKRLEKHIQETELTALKDPLEGKNGY